MVTSRLRTYLAAASIGLAGIVGAGTANAEPVKQVIPAPIIYPQEEETPAQGTGIELLLAGGDIAASILTNQILHDKYDDLALADQTNLAGHRKKTLKLKNDYEYNDLSAVTKGLEWTIIAGELAASFFATVAIHEYGHATTANIHGVGAKVHVLPSILENGTFLLGYTGYDGETYNKKSDFEKMQMDAGGMIATRTVAEKLDKIMDSTSLHPRVKQALAALYFMNRFDGPRYILSCALKSWTNNPIPQINDPQKILNFITDKNSVTTPPTDEEKIAYAIAAGAVAIDTLLDWKEIETNLKRLFAMETEAERENYNFNLSMTPGGVYANFTYEF